jgi:Tol biopolymer transport system component
MPLNPLPDAEEVAYNLKRYLSIKSAYSPEFSPDGESLAYLSDLTGVPQIWMTSLTGTRAPQQLTLEDERVGFLSFAPKSDRIAFGIDSGGSERFQIHMREGGGNAVFWPTTEPNVIHKNTPTVNTP